MKVFSLWILSFALFCSLVLGHNGDPEDDHLSNEKSALQIINSANQFAGDLFSHLAAKYSDKNVFFSPISISLAISMLSLGAHSSTLDQILEGLSLNTSAISIEDIHKGFQQVQHFLNAPNDDVTLNIANAVFVDNDKHLIPKFSDDLQHFYESEVISTDFQKPDEAKELINTYVENKTNGLIQNFLKDVNPDTVAYLINAIHFKGIWKDPFNKNFTSEQDFHVDGNTVVKVPMMTREGNYPIAFIQEVGCTVVEVPYKGNVSAIFILPEKGKLHDVEKALQNVSLQTWTEQVQPMYIQLTMPKFSVSETLDLKGELMEMGITDMFSNHANLNGITVDPLKVSEAKHEAIVTVDEAGAEAAAVTGIGIVPTSLPPSVTLDHPFLMFFKHDETGLLLFSGRIGNPKA